MTTTTHTARKSQKQYKFREEQRWQSLRELYQDKKYNTEGLMLLLEYEETLREIKKIRREARCHV